LAGTKIDKIHLASFAPLRDSLVLLFDEDRKERAMTFIDWSDSEGMFGLLMEYVADARNECTGDPARRKFLGKVLADLNAANQQFDAINPKQAIEVLRNICDSMDPQFKEDEVVIHIADCIEELEQIQ
jgi:hypothetical protein